VWWIVAGVVCWSGALVAMLQAVTSTDARCLTSLTSLAYGTDVHGLALPLHDAYMNSVIRQAIDSTFLALPSKCCSVRHVHSPLLGAGILVRTSTSYLHEAQD
jgi:hypothetical protein